MTVKTYRKQTINNRKRNKEKPRSSILGMINRATEIHNDVNLRHRIKSNKSVQTFANITKLPNSEFNDTYALAFTAEGICANPNNLNHRDTMKAPDRVRFLE